MKIQRSRYFLGGIGVLLLLLVGILWAVAAVASPSGQTQGTISLDESHVRSNCTADASDCTLEAKVTDADLSLPVPVGPEEDRTVSVTIDAAGVDASRFTTLVVDIAGGEAFTRQDAQKAGTVNVNPSMDDVLPIVGSVGIDYDGSDGIGTDKNPDVQVTRDRVQGGKQLIDLQINNDLDSGDIIALSYNTSDEEGTVAMVEGDEGTMYLNLQEVLGGSESSLGDQGSYAGTFEVASKVTIDIGDIEGEQHHVSAGLRTGRPYSEPYTVTTTGGNGVDEDANFDLKLNYPTLRDGDDDGDDYLDDIEVVGGDAEVAETQSSAASAESGIVTFTATDDIAEGSTIRVSYLGDDHFTIDLDHGPAQEELSESDIAVPQPGRFDDFYTWRGETRDTITLSVEQNTPSNGAVLAVSYKGTETIDNTDGTIDVGESFEVDLMDRDDNSPPSSITVLNAAGETVNLTASATGDGETRARATFTVPTGGTPVADGQSFYIHYDGMVIAAASNPRNALNAEAEVRPIIKVDPNPSGEVRAIYSDASGGSVTEEATVENSGPSVSDASPASGSAFGPKNAPTLMAVITDVPAPPLGSGVDTDSDEVEFYVSTTGAMEMTGGQTFTGDVSTDGGVITVSLPLINDPHKRTDSLNIEDGVVQNISWWVTVKDNVGNMTTSDAKPDDEEEMKDLGNQPYTLSIDTTAPKSQANDTVTGQSYNADDKEIERNQRNSIRLAFDDAINNDSVDTSDFTVSVGDASIAVESANAVGSDIFLTLAEDLSSDATPTVTVEDRVENSAGIALATGDIKVSDDIDPGVSVDLSTTLSKGELSVTVATDEAIIGVPSVRVFFDGARDRAAVSSAKRTSATANEWTFDIDTSKGTDTDGVYSVEASALDKARNRGTKGGDDSSAKNAITFEIDTNLTAFETADDGDFDTLSDGQLVGESDAYYFGVKWNDSDEYDDDSHDNVTLTAAVLNSGDDDEVILTSGIDPEGPATIFTITAEGLPQGEHTLLVQGMDDAGNEAEAEIDFEITELSFDIQLRRGINHISLPRDPANTDINDVFGEYAQITSVFTFTDGTANSLASFREPGSTGPFMGTLTTINASQAYGVEATGSVKVTIAIPNARADLSPPTVTVSQGWNFVPVTTLDDINVISAQSVMDADAYLGFGWTSGWTFSNNRWSSILPDPRNDNFDLCSTDLQSGEVQIGRGYWVYYEGAGSLNPGSLPRANCS